MKLDKLDSGRAAYTSVLIVMWPRQPAYRALMDFAWFQKYCLILCLAINVLTDNQSRFKDKG